MSSPSKKSTQYLNIRQQKELLESREFAEALKQDLLDQEQALKESITESNEWCQILGIQRHYRLEQVDSSQLYVWIEDSMQDNRVNEVRRVSSELFEREHHKLEALMEARQWSVEKRQGPMASPQGMNKSTFYATQLRAPISAPRSQKLRAMREQPKQAIQEELLSAISETHQLTAELELQLLQLENGGWSS